MDEYIVNENGERVRLGSRRPDGTLRKERRIKPGYIPQDEQPTYQSQGLMARQGIPKCPGLDASQASAAAAAAKSKAAKKNEKRKAKKAEEAAGGDDSAQQPSPSTSTPAAPAAAAPAAAAAAPAAAAAAPAALSAAADSGVAVLDKQIKALSKKVRQCQALVDRQAAGEALSQQEQEKVAKMPGWQEEIKQLEHEMANMGV